MHPEARRWVNVVGYMHRPYTRVVEFGSLHINGAVRDLFEKNPEVSYLGVDLVAGEGVDKVGDAAKMRWKPEHDLAICCEVLEHYDRPDLLIRAAGRALKPGGLFLITCATDPRAPHSGLDGGPVRGGEHYQNIAPEDLAGWLAKSFARYELEIHPDRGDLYAWARK